jgi:hypothetical protein
MKLIILIFSLLFINCSSNKNLTENNSLTIAFGNGGGFTGIETKYELKQDGTIYKMQMNDSSVAIVKKVESKGIEQLFKDAETLKDYKYCKPDNMYQFIEINNNRIVWGFNTENVNPKATNLYQQLTKLLK